MIFWFRLLLFDMKDEQSKAEITDEDNRGSMVLPLGEWIFLTLKNLRMKFHVIYIS